MNCRVIGVSIYTRAWAGEVAQRTTRSMVASPARYHDRGRSWIERYMKKTLVIYIAIGGLLQLVLIALIGILVKGEKCYVSSLNLTKSPPDISLISMGSIPYAYGIPIFIIGGLIFSLVRKSPEKQLVHFLGALLLTTILFVILHIIGAFELYCTMWTSGLS